MPTAPQVPSYRDSVIKTLRSKGAIVNVFSAQRSDPLDIEIPLWISSVSPEDMKRLSGLGAPVSLSLIGPGPCLEILEAASEVRLTFLRLDGTDLTNGDLNKMPIFAKLETVFVNDSPLSAKGMAALLKQPSLTSLGFSNPTSDEAIAVLREATNLRELRVFGCTLSKRSWEEITSLNQLRSLDLSYSNVTDDVIASIAENPNIVELYASATKLGVDSIRHIGKMKQLQILDLSECSTVDDESIGYLMDLECLTVIDVSGTSIGDKAIKQLATLQSLRTLDISDTAVTDASIETLMAIQDLLIVNAHDTNISASGQRALKDCCPD